MLPSGSLKDADTISVTVKDGQLSINGSKFAEAA
jgi:hypothetical protein